MPEGRRSRARLVVVAGVFVVLWAIAHYTGLTERASVGAVREAIESAGSWGMILFIVVFAIGELLHIPGMVFVGAAILAYGKAAGFGVSLIAAVVSVSLSFVVVRGLGGRALSEIEKPFMKKMLARLDARPIRTVIILRVVLWLAPALNYGLALTSIRYRDYLIGSVVGLVPPILAATVFFDWLIAYTGL